MKDKLDIPCGYTSNLDSICHKKDCMSKTVRVSLKSASVLQMLLSSIPGTQTKNKVSFCFLLFRFLKDSHRVWKSHFQQETKINSATTLITW